MILWSKGYVWTQSSALSKYNGNPIVLYFFATDHWVLDCNAWHIYPTFLYFALAVAGVVGEVVTEGDADTAEPTQDAADTDAAAAAGTESAAETEGAEVTDGDDVTEANTQEEVTEVKDTVVAEVQTTETPDVATTAEPEVPTTQGKR